MYKSFKASLAEWSVSTTDRNKLQHFYIAIAASLLIIAGVVGLLNHTLGQQLLSVAIASTVIFVINAVAWALLQSFVLFRLQTPKKLPIATEDSPEKELQSTSVKKAIKPASKKTHK